MESISTSSAVTIPTIYRSGQLSAFLLYLLDHHRPPTTLIICSSQQSFFEALNASISQDATLAQTPSSSEPVHENTTTHPLLQRTLHLLSTSRTIDVAFVTSVPTLHAYLSTLPSRTNGHTHNSQHFGSAAMPTLAIIGILTLYRPTPSFSAQGLTRAFATVVEATYERGQRLVFWEAGTTGEEAETRAEETREYTSLRNNGDSGDDGDDRLRAFARRTNPWDDKVPILDASTKTFGIGGMEREWLGRRIRIRNVVERWCRFEETFGRSD